MMGYGLMGGGGIVGLVIIVLLIYLVINLFYKNEEDHEKQRNQINLEKDNLSEDALEILNRQYVQGEISEEEFKRKRKNLHAGRGRIAIKKWPFVIIGAIILVLLVGYWTLGAVNRPGNPGSMMGNGQGAMMGESNQNVSSISSSQAKKKMDASLKNAVINKTKNTITFSGDQVHIVFFGGPEEADGKFVVGNLVNPTLYVPKNAHISMEFMNADKGMPHGLEITTANPPYGQMSMMQGRSVNGTVISPLPAAQADQFSEGQTSFQLNQSGQFYYICQYPGHAAKGMYGKIVFE